MVGSTVDLNQVLKHLKDASRDLASAQKLLKRKEKLENLDLDLLAEEIGDIYARLRYSTGLVELDEATSRSGSS